MVVLVSANNLVLVHPIGAPGTIWTSYKVPLAAASFKYKNNLGDTVSEPDFSAALADVRALRIPGEWGANVEEVVGFDSVVFKK